MFKYLWILILGLLAAAFIAYTVYAVKDCLENHVFADWGELFSTFDDEHGILLSLWIAIIMAAILVLFIVSLYVYFNSKD